MGEEALCLTIFMNGCRKTKNQQCQLLGGSENKGMT